jgi:FkbM family methyltransferase
MMIRSPAFQSVSARWGQWVYTTLVRTESHMIRDLMRRARHTLIRLSDPVVTMEVERCALLMNLSHQLPLYYHRYPTFDRALPRICSFVARREGHLTLIDVGANIGDSVRLVARNTSGRFLCVEGDRNYFQLLSHNLRGLGGAVLLENVFLGDAESFVTLDGKKQQGSLQLVVAEAGHGNDPLLPLDVLVARHREFSATNVLKIDTDGFDLKVLKGAHQLLRAASPCVFVEFYPDLLSRNGDDPESLFQFLNGFGYERCLAYDNYGQPIAIVGTGDSSAIRNLIGAIDDRTIYYYDLLLVHREKKALLPLYDLELHSRGN